MGIKNLLLTSGLFLCGALTANAQTYGQWVGATGTSYWNYDLTATAASFSTSGGAKISPSADPFLPNPPSGSTSRVFVATGSGGAFELLGTALKVTGGNSGVSKFSAYDVTDASAVTSLFFDIDFNSTTATNGNFILGIGKNISGNVFNNTNNITSASSPGGGLFGALQFAFFGGTNVQVLYRKPVTPAPTPATYTYSGSNTTLIPNRTSGALRVEIYCNNYNVSQTYIRSSVSYILPAQTFNVYIGGVAAVIDGVTNIPATSEGVAVGDVINAFTFNASGNTNPTANALNYTLSNMKIGGVTQSVLPVTFKSFDGIKINNSVKFNWSTASELNNKRFEILKSSKGGDFISIGSVDGNGNSSEVNNYSFTDYSPATGTNYYKLKQTDLDGKSTYFEKILAFDFNFEATPFSGFVNAESKLILTYSADKTETVTVTITNLSGKKMISKKLGVEAGLNQFSVDMDFITSGLYVATVTSSSKNSSIKFVK